MLFNVYLIIYFFTFIMVETFLEQKVKIFIQQIY